MVGDLYCILAKIYSTEYFHNGIAGLDEIFVQ